MMSKIIIALIKSYKLLLSPVLGQRCRFEPSCSEYAAEAVKIHGAGYGLWYALKRVCNCHPLSAGGYDPVPPARKSHRV